MRLHTLALSAIIASIAPPTCAFTPSIQTARVGSTKVSPRMVQKHQESSNDVNVAAPVPALSSASASASNAVEQAKKGFASIFAASTIFIAASTGSPLSFVEPAHAATTAAPAPAPTTQVAGKTNANGSANAKKAPVDPLASEKAALETAKSQLAAASAEVGKAKKVLGDANVAFTKASDAVAAGDRKVTAAKKALITANDKLANAKAKEGRGDMNALKEVESLADKVGTLYILYF